MVMEYTAKQAAYDIAIGWLHSAYHDIVSDIDIYANTATDRKRVKIQIAKLHNRLMAQAGLDGLPLDETGVSR